MAKGNSFDLPLNWYLQVDSGDGCFATLECASWDTVTENTGETRENYGCVGLNGETQIRGSFVQRVVPDRGTVAVRSYYSDAQILFESERLSRSSGCTFNWRLANICDGRVIGWHSLDDVSLDGGKVFPAINRDLQTNEKVQITFNVTWNGLLPFTNLQNISITDYDFTEADETPVDVRQCEGAICATGEDVCGNQQTKRGLCDKWELFVNDDLGTVNGPFKIYTSTDGGNDYDTTNEVTVADNGQILYVDCDFTLTTLGSTIQCGSEWQLEDMPVTPATNFTAGAACLLVYDNNGTVVKNTTTGAWFTGKASDGATAAQNVAGGNCDAGVYFTGGGDNGGNAATYQYSLDGGNTWLQGSYPSPAGVATSAFRAVNVFEDGTITATVLDDTAGTPILYVITTVDGVNWETIGQFSTSPIVGTVDIFRPDGSITYLVIDNQLWLNDSGLCECKPGDVNSGWRQLRDDLNASGIWGVCADNPLQLHYTY